jgi:hypothetical protein
MLASHQFLIVDVIGIYKKIVYCHPTFQHVDKPGHIHYFYALNLHGKL